MVARARRSSLSRRAWAFWRLFSSFASFGLGLLAAEGEAEATERELARLWWTIIVLELDRAPPPAAMSPPPMTAALRAAFSVRRRSTACEASDAASCSAVS